MTTRSVLLLLLLISFRSGPAAAENWPGWRGPCGDGSSLEKNLPLHWNGPHSENIAWKVAIPGTGHASPIVWGDRIFVVSCREETEQRILLCLDRASGRILWEREVLHAPLERKNPLNSYASSTPATDGKLVYVTFLEASGKLLFMTAGYPTFHILAIRPDGQGDVTKTHVAWQTTKDCAYVPSPIIAGGDRYLMLVSDGGIASCFEAQSGERHWRERIGSHFSASPVEAEGRVFFLSNQGETTIIQAGPEFSVAAKNELGEECRALPAVSQGRIYIRGETNLYCIGR